MDIAPKAFRDLDPGKRVLMRPGPSDVPARVLQAMGAASCPRNVFLFLASRAIPDAG